MTEVKERPILFSAPMVRAILAGKKTQTRRILKPQPTTDDNLIVGPFWPTVVNREGIEVPGDEKYGVFSEDGDWSLPCPYGKQGERLWVRETWGTYAIAKINEEGIRYVTGYRATAPQDKDGNEIPPQYGWRPSIHMPRSESRILLEIVSVRVERVQDTSEEDARAEGISKCVREPHGTYCGIEGFLAGDDTEGAPIFGGSVGAYAALWDSINGDKPGHDWASNPYVWVVEFRNITAAQDAN